MLFFRNLKSLLFHQQLLHFFNFLLEYTRGECMNIGFISLGCCKNLTDSEHIMGMLKANGHHMVSDAEVCRCDYCQYMRVY